MSPDCRFVRQPMNKSNTLSGTNFNSRLADCCGRARATASNAFVILVAFRGNDDYLLSWVQSEDLTGCVGISASPSDLCNVPANTMCVAKIEFNRLGLYI